MDWQEWLEKGKWGEGGWMEDGKEFRKDPKTGKKFEVKKPEKPKPTMFPRIIREFPDEKDEDPMVYDNKTASWESWLEKNNAIETSHKEGEKKEEWDGKFSSSTIRDDVKDDDKAVSEEESLEELTDGKLEEVEKLKAWEVFMVNKMPMNQYDKQPQKKRTVEGDGVTLDTNVGTVKAPLTETVPVSNPRGSLGNKKVKRIDHEAGDGSRKIVEIPKEDNTNPEIKFMSGGRPESGKQGSINATAGGKGKVTEQNTNSMLYNVLSEEAKKREIDSKTDNKVTISNDSTEPATPIVPETAEAKRRRLIQGTYRKERNTDGSIKQSNSTVTNWEAWLNKYEETPEDKKLALQLDEARAITGKKVATQKVKPETGEDAKMGEYSTITAEKFKSWEGWLEKMQGAGDARYGNQHLTGLDQKPVNNEEDEANILPEKEEKTDNKEEKQEETDNKPYKALGGE